MTSCHICSRDISGDGGTCARCEREACVEHLFVIVGDGPDERMAVCAKCISDGDTVDELYEKAVRACRIPVKDE